MGSSGGDQSSQDSVFKSSSRGRGPELSPRALLRAKDPQPTQQDRAALLFRLDHSPRSTSGHHHHHNTGGGGGGPFSGFQTHSPALSLTPSPSPSPSRGSSSPRHRRGNSHNHHLFQQQHQHQHQQHHHRPPSPSPSSGRPSVSRTESAPIRLHDQEKRPSGFGPAASIGLALSAQCKFIRVQLPVGFGFQTVDCKDLNTVGDITERLWAIRKRKKLALPGKHWTDFEWHFPESPERIGDQKRIMELPTLRSLFKHLRKKQSNLTRRARGKRSEDMNKSTLNALNMIDDNGPDNSGSGQIMQLVLKLKKQKKGLAEAGRRGRSKSATNHIMQTRLTEGPQLQKLRAMLLEKIDALVSGSKAKDGHQPKAGQVIISGEMGLGKTKLLESTIDEARAGLGTDSRVYYTAGSQFDMKKPLSAMRDVFLQIIDQRILQNYESYTGTLYENRRALVVETLGGKHLPVLGCSSVSLLDVGAVLNQPLHLDIEESRYTTAMSTDERVATATRLLVYLLELFTLERPAVIMVDDAIFLDRHTWCLLLAVAERVPRVLLIIATRPLNRSYMAAFTKGIPQEFRRLLDLPSTLYVPLRPRSDAVLYKIACLSLGVADMPPILADFVLARANGNPKVAKEFCYELNAEYEVFTIEDGQVILKPEFEEKDTGVWARLAQNLKCPFSIRALIARRLDRLPYKAQMMLKISALIGQRFSFRTIEQTFPLKDTKSLDTEFAKLEEFRIIKEADPPLVGWVSEKDKEWSFVETFMQAMLKKRLLSNQTKQLRVKILNARVARLVELLRQMKQSSTHVGQSEFSGQLNGKGRPEAAVKHCELDFYCAPEAKLRGRGASDASSAGIGLWQSRYCVLSYKGLFILDSKASWLDPETSKRQILFWVRLNTATVLQDGVFAGRNFTLLLADVNDYYDREQNELFETPRQFRIALGSYKTMEAFCKIIQSVNQQVTNRHHLKKKSLKTRSEKWAKLREEQAALLRLPHDELERSRYVSSFNKVLVGFKRRERDQRADECSVKKLRGGFITSMYKPAMYKRRWIMLVSSSQVRRQMQQAIDQKVGLGLRRASMDSAGGKKEDEEAGGGAGEEEENVQVLLLSKTDARKDSVVITDAVCLSTRQCNVRRKDGAVWDQHQEKQGKPGKAKGSKGLSEADSKRLSGSGAGGTLVISGQLWCKKSVSWEHKTMEIQFATTEHMHFWFHKIHDAIHKQRRRPNIAESRLAGEYDSEEVRAMFTMKPQDDDVNSLLRHTLHGTFASVNGSRANSPTHGIVSPAASATNFPSPTASKESLSHSMTQGGHRQHRVLKFSARRPASLMTEAYGKIDVENDGNNNNNTDLVATTGSSLTRVVLTEPDIQTRESMTAIVDDEEVTSRPRGVLAPARALGELQREPNARGPKKANSRQSSSLSVEMLSTTSSVAGPYFNETGSEASLLTEIAESPAERGAAERLLAKLDALEEAIAQSEDVKTARKGALGKKGLITEKLSELRHQLVLMSVEKESRDLMTSTMEPHVDRSTSQWIKSNYSRRRPTRPHKMSWTASPGTQVLNTGGRYSNMMKNSFTLGESAIGEGLVNPIAESTNHGRQLLDEGRDVESEALFQLLDSLIPRGQFNSPGRLFSAQSVQRPIGTKFGNLRSWGWDVFGHNDEELFMALALMYEQCGLFDIYSIDRTVFAQFVSEIRNRYLETPYHNFKHAVDVTQTVFCLMKDMNLSQGLTSLECLALLTAALCHDVQHPGLNNDYHVASHSPLAVLYNDEAVLENMHAAVAFAILAQPSCNIFANLTRKQYQAVRQMMIQMILATDMTCHKSMLKTFNKLLGSAAAQASIAQDGPQAEVSKNELQERRRNLLNVFLHASDISNPCKPWDLCLEWSNRITTEFFNQGDREKAEGLPVSSNNDRKLGDQANISLNFIDFIVGPMFVSIRRLLPRVDVCLAQLQKNRARWFERLRKSTKYHEDSWTARNKSFESIISSAVAPVNPKDEAFPPFLSFFNPKLARGKSNSRTESAERKRAK